MVSDQTYPRTVDAPSPWQLPGQYARAQLPPGPFRTSATALLLEDVAPLAQALGLAQMAVQPEPAAPGIQLQAVLTVADVVRMMAFLPPSLTVEETAERPTGLALFFVDSDMDRSWWIQSWEDYHRMHAERVTFASQRIERLMRC